MFGGLLTSFAMELLIYPVIFLVAEQFEMWRGALGPRLTLERVNTVLPNHYSAPQPSSASKATNSYQFAII